MVQCRQSPAGRQLLAGPRANDSTTTAAPAGARCQVQIKGGDGLGRGRGQREAPAMCTQGSTAAGRWPPDSGTWIGCQELTQFVRRRSYAPGAAAALCLHEVHHALLQAGG